MVAVHKVRYNVIMILGPEQTPNEKTTLDNCGLARRNLVLLKAVHTNCDSWNMNRYPLTLLKMANMAISWNTALKKKVNNVAWLLLKCNAPMELWYTVPYHVKREHVQNSEARNHVEEQVEPLLRGGDPAAEGGRVVELDTAHGHRVHEELCRDHHEEDGANDGAHLLQHIPPSDARRSWVVDLVHEDGEQTEHEEIAATDVVGEVVILGLVVQFEKAKVATFLQNLAGLWGQRFLVFLQLFGRVLEFLLYLPKIPVVKGKRVALHNKHHGVQEQEDSRDPVEIKVVDVNGERHGDESQLEDAHCNEPSPLPVDDPLFHQPVHENHEESAQEHCQVQHCDREQVRCHVLHDFQLIPCTAVRRIVICAAPDGYPAQEHPCEHVDP
ncbi:ANM_HP_G0005300.mRNA.1.CDS.1 [Saccharomyces cerevisiae]|nr:ANM_HP_G0119900.mRNA.1.CDS.1 [Saccharomyces cerevisiae]CAI5219687.1 ANM_HP_G0034410.mRNA.1.CDS.1 [Saccharomyces cerevisiae]CAI5223823.1 ANM_HP_G0058520.mRNA.1.CDS.1 [Saccharomyces cerevisiae]CAI5224736.1 ANM_HP_G0067720.mRNA.1.CDS.1 [Saccharomyces cerevisiae]CAI5226248.1 ANM_HP_G0005300.mRNA.1.CDS.1 [Saccharomyces cerevisiae]